MLIKTKVSNGNYTIIPSRIRRKLKRVTLDDITGIISSGGDAVKAKKRGQSGS